MKKKIYNQPTTDVVEIQTPNLMLTVSTNGSYPSGGSIPDGD